MHNRSNSQHQSGAGTTQQNWLASSKAFSGQTKQNFLHQQLQQTNETFQRLFNLKSSCASCQKEMPLLRFHLSSALKENQSLQYEIQFNKLALFNRDKLIKDLANQIVLLKQESHEIQAFVKSKMEPQQQKFARSKEVSNLIKEMKAENQGYGIESNLNLNLALQKSNAILSKSNDFCNNQILSQQQSQSQEKSMVDSVIVVQNNKGDKIDMNFDLFPLIKQVEQKTKGKLLLEPIEILPLKDKKKIVTVNEMAYYANSQRNISNLKVKQPAKKKQIIQKIAPDKTIPIVTESQGVPGKQVTQKTEQASLNAFSLDEGIKKENENLPFVEELVWDQNALMEKVLTLNDQKQQKFCTVVVKLCKNFRRCQSLIQNLNLLLRTALEISSSLDFEKALQNVTTKSCEILNCEMTKIYIVNQQSKEIELKTQTRHDIMQQIPSQVLKLAMGEGIAGYVAYTKETVNLENNAFQDRRYEAEKENNPEFKAETLLAIPIINRKDSVIAIIEVINKNQNFAFGIDDVSLLGVIGNIVQQVLENSQIYHQIGLKQHNLSMFINSSLKLFSANSLHSLYFQFIANIQEIFKTDNVKVFFQNQQTKKYFYFVLSDNSIREMQEINQGILGKSIKERRIIETFNPYTDSDHNIQCDIDTNLPITSGPIIDEEKQEVLGGFQCASLKQFVEQAYTGKNEIKDDILAYHNQIFCVVLKKLLTAEYQAHFF